MSEACAAVIAFFFEQVGANRVYATHDPRNPHSGAVMRKCGMRYEGTLRHARYRKGEYSDRVYYAILAEDYFQTGSFFRRGVRYGQSKQDGGKQVLVKIMKRAAVILLAAAVGVSVFAYAFLAAIGPRLNDRRAAGIEKRFVALSLPPETELLETASYCGNMSGTGNHAEIWAGVLIHTELNEEEIRRYFSDYEIVWRVPEDLENQYPGPKDFIDSAFSYSELDFDRPARGYYIIGDYYEPFTQWDLRGH